MLKSKFSLKAPDESDEEDTQETAQVQEKPQSSQPQVATKKKKKTDSKEKVHKEKAVKSEMHESITMDDVDAMGEMDGEDGHVDLMMAAGDILDEKKLHTSEISVRLSWLGKTADGDAYTYLKVKCTGLSVTSINAIKSFKHLQFVDLSDNLLTLEALQPVTELPYLLLIHADINKLKSAALNRCKYLQVIIMNNNSILSIEDVFQPELSTLEVGYNHIKEINFINRMPQLRVLDFRHNFIADISNIDFPNLDCLYLAGNKIKDLTGISSLPNLRILHVRGNPVRFLNGFETPLPKLKYLNLRNTKIGTLRQIRRLKNQPALEALVLTGTYYMGGEGKEDAEAAAAEDDPELRVEVLATLPRLKKFNKGIYTPEERQEAKDLQQQWLEEGDKEEDEEVDEEERGEEEDPGAQ